MSGWKDGSFFAAAVIEPGVENMVRYVEKAKKEYGFMSRNLSCHPLRQNRRLSNMAVIILAIQSETESSMISES